MHQGTLSRWLLTCLILLAVVELQVKGAHSDRPEAVPVQILAINDFHGQVSPGKKVNGRPVGSAPVLAAYLKKEQQDFAGSTFIVHAGDLVGASPPASALLQDEPAIMFMNLLGNRECSPRNRLNPKANLVATVGNHEFDEGVDELLRLLRGGNSPQGPFLEDPWQGAAFPSVAANVGKKGTNDPFCRALSSKKSTGSPLPSSGRCYVQPKTW